MSACGIVLAAGAGVRFGGPKALARDLDGTPWVATAVETLRVAGCEPVLVALGARAADAVRLVPVSAVVVDVPRWSEGLSTTLRTVLAAAEQTDAEAALIIPVDVPELPAAACLRVLAAGVAPTVLARATYAGRPGHPVLIGRAHWAPLTDHLAGDTGGGPYLHAQGATAVACEDLWNGHDIDTRQ